MSRSPSSTPSPAPSDEPTDTTAPGTRQEVTVGDTLARDLAVPWGVAFIPGGGGAALVAERDSGRILRVTGQGRTKVLGTVPGVQHGGEGGLLGLAIDPDDPDRVYAYLTSVQGDNRIVRMTYSRTDLGSPSTIFTGIPSGAIHNGGRIAFGPDGNLYVGTGEAGLRDPAQDKGSLGGKILRITPSGKVPDDNPFRGSPVWSLGHRNVQGLAFDSTGRLWASEFGQDTWDELNQHPQGRQLRLAGGRGQGEPVAVRRPARGVAPGGRLAQRTGHRRRRGLSRGPSRCTPLAGAPGRQPPR